jgi:hypothetical protein
MTSKPRQLQREQPFSIFDKSRECRFSGFVVLPWLYVFRNDYLRLVMSTISKRKDKRFDIEAYYRNESTTFWFGLLIIGPIAKYFDLVHKNCIASKSFSFWPKNSGTKQTNLIWSGYYPRQSRTFLFNPKTNRSKQNILIWSAYYQNESKRFWIGPLIIGTKAKQFDLLRIISAKMTLFKKGIDSLALSSLLKSWKICRLRRIHS